MVSDLQILIRLRFCMINSFNTHLMIKIPIPIQIENFFNAEISTFHSRDFSFICSKISTEDRVLSFLKDL